MPRFTNSNRHAAEVMNHTASKRIHREPLRQIERSYFRRIGFDFAMI